MLRIRKDTAAATEAWTDLLPGEVGRGLHEDCDYLLGPGLMPEARIFVDDVELAKHASGLFKWRPSFYAGRVTVDVVLPSAQGAHDQYFIDVSPSPAKSGQRAFDEMVADIRAFDQALLGGTSSASLEFGHGGAPGRFGLDILLSRLKAHGPAFLGAVEAIARSPHRSLAPLSRLLPLSRIRRLHHSSLRDRRLAALATGQTPGLDSFDSLQVNSQTSAPTFDTPANRALFALVRRFRAALSSMQDSVKALKLGSPPEEQMPRMDRRVEDLRTLELRARNLLFGPLFSEVSSGETTAAGLTQIAAQPTYSRAYRIGSRALSTSIEGEDRSDQLHAAPSWGIYETWCYIQVLKAVREVTRAQGVETAARAVAAERGFSFALSNGTTLEVLFQATFPALRPSSKRLGWSLSRERRPDIVLVHTSKTAPKTLVLDAKWRSGRENVLDAMQSAHIYHDSLRVGDKAPTICLLLLPGVSAEPDLETSEFIEAHRVGALSNVRVYGDGASSLAARLQMWLLQ